MPSFGFPKWDQGIPPGFGLSPVWPLKKSRWPVSVDRKGGLGFGSVVKQTWHPYGLLSETAFKAVQKTSPNYSQSRTRPPFICGGLHHVAHSIWRIYHYHLGLHVLCGQGPSSTWRRPCMSILESSCYKGTFCYMWSGFAPVLKVYRGVARSFSHCPILKLVDRKLQLFSVGYIMKISLGDLGECKQVCSKLGLPKRESEVCYLLIL